MTAEERFLARLALGKNISQDDYGQMIEFIAPSMLARALLKRFIYTGDMRTLIEAARLFNEAGEPYQALEVCSRYPKFYELRQIKGKILPLLRETYQDDFPATHQVGKLLDEAFLVVDLVSGAVTRYPPLMPSTLQEDAA